MDGPQSIELTPSTVFNALCNLYRTCGNQPVSFDNLLAYLKQNGFGDTWTGSLEAQVEAALHRLVSECRVSKLHFNFYIPTGSPQRMQPPPSFPRTAPTVPLNFHQRQDPSPPTFWQRKVSTPIPIQHVKTPTSEKDKRNIYRSFLQRPSSFSTTPLRTTDDEEEIESGDDPWTPNHELNTSFQSTFIFDQFDSGSLRPTSELSTPSSRQSSLITSAFSTRQSMEMPTATDEMPRPFRQLTVSPNDFQRFVNRAVSEPKKSRGVQDEEKKPEVDEN